MVRSRRRHAALVVALGLGLLLPGCHLSQGFGGDVPVPKMAGEASVIPPHCQVAAYRYGCANAQNLQAMVADPSHLTGGVGDDGTLGVLDAAAVNRLRQDKVKELSGQTSTGTTTGAR